MRFTIMEFISDLILFKNYYFYAQMKARISPKRAQLKVATEALYHYSILCTKYVEQIKNIILTYFR